MPISKPLFEFAAAARTTDLLNFPYRFHRAIDIVDQKTCLAFNNNFGERPAMENPQRFGGKRTIIGLRAVTIMLPKAAKLDSVAVTVQRPHLHFGVAAYAFSGQGKCFVDLVYSVGCDQFQIVGNVLWQTAAIRRDWMWYETSA
jgi:hypothetical protein